MVFIKRQQPSVHVTLSVTGARYEKIGEAAGAFTGNLLHPVLIFLGKLFKITI